MGAKRKAKICGYEVEKTLGSGTYGAVHLVKTPDGRGAVALKKMLTHATFYRVAIPDSDFFREVAYTRACDHPNIISVIDYHFSAKEWCTVMPVMTTDLDSHYRANIGTYLGLNLIVGVGRGLGYLHSLGILHLDIKPPNILIAEDGTPKIADFGLATILRPRSETNTIGNLVQTPGFRAPEVTVGEFSDEPYEVCRGTDVWSLAMMSVWILGGPYLTDIIDREFAGKSTVEEAEGVLASHGLNSYRQTNPQVHFVTEYPIIPSRDRPKYKILFEQLSLAPEKRMPAYELVDRLAGVSPSSRAIPPRDPPPKPRNPAEVCVHKWFDRTCRALVEDFNRPLIRGQAKRIYQKIADLGSLRGREPEGMVLDGVCALLLAMMMCSAASSPAFSLDEAMRPTSDPKLGQVSRALAEVVRELDFRLL